MKITKGFIMDTKEDLKGLMDSFKNSFYYYPEPVTKESDGVLICLNKYTFGGDLSSTFALELLNDCLWEMDITITEDGGSMVLVDWGAVRVIPLHCYGNPLLYIMGIVANGGGFMKLYYADETESKAVIDSILLPQL